MQCGPRSFLALQASRRLLHPTSCTILLPLSSSSSSRRHFAVPPPATSIPEFFGARVEAEQDKDVLRICHQFYEQEGLRWTWNELNNWSNAWARGILAARMSRGSRFAVSLANDAESIVTDLAAARVGVALAPLSPTANAIEIEHCFHHTRPRAVMVMDKFQGEWRTAVVRQVLPELVDMDYGTVLKSPRFPSIRTAIHTGPDLSHGFVQFRDLYMKNPLIDPLDKVKVSGDDVALEVLKSDSWIPVTQAFITKAAVNFANAVGLLRSDRVNVNLPLHTLTGKIAGLYGVLANLSVIVIPSQVFDPKETLRTIQEESCNVLLLSPSQLEEVVKLAAGSKLANLDQVIVVNDTSSVVKADLVSSAKASLRVSNVKVATLSPSGSVTVA